MEIEADSPQVKIPPPLIFLVCLIMSAGAQTVWPIHVLSPGPRWSLAAFFLVAGIALMAHCVVAFRSRKTHLEPWKSTSTIITSGIYQYSRNPIYIAFILIGWGIAFAANNFWIFGTMFLFALIVRRTAVAKEEKYLEQKFGDSYLAYKRQVRRWL